MGFLDVMTSRLNEMVARGIVRLSDPTRKCTTVQVTIYADEVRDDVEHFEQNGVTFRPYDRMETVLVGVAGDANHLISIGSSGRGARPKVAVDPGEGGLYYAGEYKLFVAKDGSLHLGKKDPTDYVALASKVDAELAKIQATLGTGSNGGGSVTFGTPYARAPVGSTTVRAE